MDEEGAYDRLLGACPEVLADGELARWVACFEEEDRPDRYVRLAAVAHHVVGAAAAGRVDEVRDVLDAAEAVLEDPGADADAVALVRMGLVEPVQNICSHDDVPVDADDLVPMLGPRSREVWEVADRLWAEAGRRSDGTPRVTVADYRSVTDPDLKRYLRSGRRRLPDGRLMAANDIVRYQGRLRGAASVSTEAGSPGPWVWAAVLLVVLALAVIALV